jgi:hypothetical protein
MKSVRSCRKALKELLLDLYDFKRHLPSKSHTEKVTTTLPNPSYIEGIRIIQTAEIFGVVSPKEGEKLRVWVYDLTTEMDRVGQLVYETPINRPVKPITKTQIPDYPI